MGAALRARAGRGSGWPRTRTGRSPASCAFAHGQTSREDRTLVPGLAHVSAVFVEPERWRRGIARQMLDAARGGDARRRLRPSAAVDPRGLPGRAALRGARLGPRRPPRRLSPYGAWRSWPTSRRSEAPPARTASVLALQLQLRQRRPARVGGLVVVVVGAGVVEVDAALGAEPEAGGPAEDVGRQLERERIARPGRRCRRPRPRRRASPAPRRRRAGRPRRRRPRRRARRAPGSACTARAARRAGAAAATSRRRSSWRRRAGWGSASGGRRSARCSRSKWSSGTPRDRGGAPRRHGGLQRTPGPKASAHAWTSPFARE